MTEQGPHIFGMAEKGKLVWLKHYEVLPIRSIADIRTVFNETVDFKYNWIFFATGGVHGTSTTVSELFQETEYGAAPTAITVLIVQPRLCNLYYGHIEIEKSDIEYFKYLATKTVEAIEIAFRETVF